MSGGMVELEELHAYKSGLNIRQPCVQICLCTIWQVFQQILVKYGLRSIRFHDLRHSCVTIMLYLNYTMKDVQQWFGHSNYNFTANRHVHISKTPHIQMTESFADRLPAIGPVVTVEG